MISVLRRLPIEARLGLGVLVLVVMLGALIPALSRYDPLTSADDPLLPVSALHPFGTDQLGRDIFVRAFAAARLDIMVACIGVAIPLLIGTFAGAVVGTTHNILIQSVWTIVVDAINAFPLIVLVMGVVAVVGSGVEGIIVALAMTNWSRHGKLARARALTIREADFIQATYVLGYSRARVLLRHIVPNIYSTTLAYGLSDFVIVIVTIAGLSFLGVGVRPPTPEWGAMMSEGRLFLTSEWWITVFPGVILSLTAIGVALVAEGAIRITRGETQ